ncbi:breast carcinoma-amplified sequence 1 isoform X4 [Syngnathus typhle]|uniref:breast carcinoma-amplified sequence 1 isoform X4 n=1 Tax=Syngnathus typhle TaxID=161592 RepID=UPI002A6AEA6D|nr:breast carcinoma-amplified sequence 1 isoform X4 [Syngnathus typhle]
MILSTTAVGKHSWAEVTSPPLLTGCYSTCCLPREDLIYLDLKSRLVSMGSEHSKNKDPSKVNQCDKNGGLNGLAENMTSNGLENEAESLTPNQQTSKVAAFNSDADSEYVVMHLDSQQAETQVVPEKPSATSETEEAEKPGAKMHFFDKIFKRKAEPEAPVDAEHVAVEETHENIAIEASLPTTDTQLATANQNPEALTEPDGGNPEPIDNANCPPAEDKTNPEESPVMNFFKNLNLTVAVPSLVRQTTPTKTSKKETSEVITDQRQREKQPAPTTTVAQVSDPPAASKGMLIPPPPPPELPKLEVKVELSGKAAKASTSKEKTKAAAKGTEFPKGKSAKDVLSKFFHSKPNKETQEQEAEVDPIVEKQETPVDVPQAVVQVKMTLETPPPEVENEKVDPSKAGTLEATAKQEPPPPVQQEKKTPSKSSFFSFFKPNASDPKKVSPAPVKAADASPTVKTKEEPKAAAKSCEVVIDDKAASVAPKAGDSAANAAKKSEKRNSIQLFLKHLGQKRHSTDAGVQTEPVTVAPAK